MVKTLLQAQEHIPLLRQLGTGMLKLLSTTPAVQLHLIGRKLFGRGLARWAVRNSNAAESSLLLLPRTTYASTPPLEMSSENFLKMFNHELTQHLDFPFSDLTSLSLSTYTSSFLLIFFCAVWDQHLASLVSHGHVPSTHCVAGSFIHVFDELRSLISSHGVN